MIVGGYAMAYHGFPRFTKDIDIFLKTQKKIRYPKAYGFESARAK